jgi:hypothetical protein
MKKSIVLALSLVYLVQAVKFEPASGLPPGTEGKGEETWRAAVGGKTLLSEGPWKAGPADMAANSPSKSRSGDLRASLLLRVSPSRI